LGQQVPDAEVSSEGVSLTRLAGPPGVLVEMTCTPTGLEICFDATDNNCNGIIDEGCGVGTGTLQFSVAWDDGSDLDLEVTDPRGRKAHLEGENGEGLVKDRDCGGLRDACQGQNTENVFFTGDRPTSGSYAVLIKMTAPAPSAHFPFIVRFGSRVGARTFGATIELATAKDEKTFAVVVDSDAL
jgi:hypothetical protein